MACGSPASEPVPPAAKSPEAVAPEPERVAPPPPMPRGPTASPAAPPPSTRLTTASRAPSAAPAAPAPSSHRAAAERAQQEAWAQWYAALRDSPDRTVRLQALDHWAQQPGASLDPLTYALVDGDEDVRARAQDLYA